MRLIADADLHPTTRVVLEDMYRSDTLLGTESPDPVPLDKLTRIRTRQGKAIHNFMRAHSVRKSLEIGFAYGFSTIWMLDALRFLPNSRHIAIDPFERSVWHGVGLAQVKRLGFDFDFHWIEDCSIHALSDLIRQKERFDFIYIDGNHRFDDVLVDFYLADQVLQCGGVIALDDIWMRSIQSAAAFIQKNRAYEAVSQSCDDIMLMLQKQREDDRTWDHFTPFKVAAEPGLLLGISARALSRLRSGMVKQAHLWSYLRKGG